MMKKIVSLSLALLLALSLTACGSKQEAPAPAEPPVQETPVQEEAPAASVEAPVTTRIAALKGPTAMGLVKLMSDAPHSADGPMYDFTLAGAADEVTPSLIKGDLDMACVPAVNTLGVIYIVENGNAVQSMADLAGKTIVAAGKGSTPEYALRYLLSENGIDPNKDVTIDWKSEHSECVAALAAGSATIALLPQPFVTVAQTKIDGLRMALDLTAEWDALDNGSGMITGVVVARKSFVEEHPAAVGAFLQNYAASVNWANSNNADAAQLISQYGIVEAAPVAEKALPYCNIVCITGEEMREKLSGYLQVLFDANPTSVGGKLPGDDFYYSSNA